MNETNPMKNAEGYTDLTAYEAIKNADVMERKIKRGDIFFTNATGTEIGSEQKFNRPAVIVSNNLGNHYSKNVEVVFLTTKNKKPMPTHVIVKSTVESTALCEEVTTVSKMRLGNYIRTCTPEEMAGIDKALRVSIGLEPESPKEEEKQNPDEAMIRMEAELNVFKNLYEQLIEKMSGMRVNI